VSAEAAWSSGASGIACEAVIAVRLRPNATAAAASSFMWFPSFKMGREAAASSATKNNIAGWQGCTNAFEVSRKASEWALNCQFISALFGCGAPALSRAELCAELFGQHVRVACARDIRPVAIEIGGQSLGLF
jgi:hypothetical protein